MKTVSSDGHTYDLYFTDIKMYESLPADYYSVRYEERRGFYLEKQDPFVIKDTKVYGVNDIKISKVLNTFAKVNKNLGIILSGLKGMGKSLFAKQLAIQMVNKGYPVITVDRYIQGVEEFLKRMDQEVMILFDEFDKTFFDPENTRGINDPQTYILGLFDGIDVGKKLFVITCNDIDNLSDYIVNRPGRFHYHFTFDTPSKSDIIEYLNDNLSEDLTDKEKVIQDLLKFDRFYSLNYDTLRSIVFELNNGYSLAETLDDLNIINQGYNAYTPMITYSKENHTTVTIKCERVKINILGNNYSNMSLYDYDNGSYYGTIKINPSKLFVNNNDIFEIDPKEVVIVSDDKDDDINCINTVIKKLEFIPYSPFNFSKFSKLLL